MFRSVQLGSGYVESTSLAYLWIVTKFKGSDVEFVNGLKQVFLNCYNHIHQRPKPSDCCVKTISESPKAKYCLICGAKLAKLEEQDQDERNEAIREWFVSLVNGTYNDHGQVMEWFEDHGVFIWPQREAMHLSKCLYIINAFEYFLTDDLRMVEIYKSPVKLSKMQEIKLK